MDEQPETVQEFIEETNEYSERMEEVASDFRSMTLSDLAPMMEKYQEAGQPYGDQLPGLMRYYLERMMLEVIDDWAEDIRSRHRNPKDLPTN